MSDNRTRCPSCGKAFRIKAEFDGAHVRCTSCQKKFIVELSDKTESAKTDSASAIDTASGAEAPVVQPMSRSDSQLSHSASTELSPYEALASDLMGSDSSGRPPGRGSDYMIANRQLNMRGGLSESSSQNSVGYLFSGFVLISFGAMLFAMTFFAPRFSGLRYVPLAAGMTASLSGLIGAIMMMMGLKRNVLAGILWGAIPGLLFIAGALLVMTLESSGYWTLDQPVSRGNNMATGGRRSSATGIPRSTRNPTNNSNRNSSIGSRRGNSNPATNPSVPANRSEGDSPFEDQHEEIMAEMQAAAEKMRKAIERQSSGHSSPGSQPLESSPFQNDSPSAESPPADATNTPFSHTESGVDSPANNPPESAPSVPGFSDDDMANPFAGGRSKSVDENSSASNLTSNPVVAPPATSAQKIGIRRYDVSTLIDFNRRKNEFKQNAVNVFGVRMALQGLPAKNMTEYGGNSSGVFKAFLVADAKQPLLGLDAVYAARGGNIQVMVPVFSQNDDGLTVAKPGYAIGGIYVNANSEKVTGFQCLFMKLKEERLDPSDSYLGDWVGDDSNLEELELISSKGELVVGLAVIGGNSVEAISLIHQ